MKKKNPEFERNQVMTTPAVFMESYNQTAPLNFRRVSIEILKQFRVAHPALFTRGNEWSIGKHRKRLMDWLASRRDA